MKTTKKWIGLLAALLLLTLASCGDDEPAYMVGYYMNIQSQVRLNLSDNDESQGTTSDTPVDVLSTTVKRMKAALAAAYPQHTAGGNDVAVLTACDQIYREYKAAYSTLEGHTVCVITLYKTKLNDHDIVQESTVLTTYRFGDLSGNSTQPTL